jgi:wyosine [tRNA(Phe)-imidazoG37] synthetase (radical SAM superfamily)
LIKEPFQSDDIVKTCCKLESGLNLAINGLRACTRGALMPPLFCSAKEISRGAVTRGFIVAKRKEYIRMLNDDQSEMDCKRCLMVEKKRYGDISFSGLGHIDLQHYSMCNLRCTYCAYTRDDIHLRPQYDALNVLRLFSPEDVQWNAHVDLAGGEPTLLENLEDYLEFFRTRRIRVLMYTNSVELHPAICDGLTDGTIYMVVTSLDAGMPSTYKALRGQDKYLRVMENLSHYAAAGNKKKGMLIVKYIFCDSNCSDDDIAGFAYAMLALRPQQVWLTIDFASMYLRKTDHDYSKQIKAYAKMYLLLKKHGIEAFHYYREAIATFSLQGKRIMDSILAAIERQSSITPLGDPDLVFEDFRGKAQLAMSDPDKFSINPLTLISRNGSTEKWNIEGKRVLLVPACPTTQKLLSEPEIQRAAWIGFADRNPIQQGKTIEGRTIYSYEAISTIGVDIILMAPPEKHRRDILSAVACNITVGTRIAELALHHPDKTNKLLESIDEPDFLPN